MAPSSRIPTSLAPALSPTSPSTRPLRPAHFAATNAPQISPPPTPLRPRWRGPLSSSPSHHAARSLPLSSSEGKGREEKRESEQGRRRPRCTHASLLLWWTRSVPIWMSSNCCRWTRHDPSWLVPPPTPPERGKKSSAGVNHLIQGRNTNQIVLMSLPPTSTTVQFQVCSRFCWQGIFGHASIVEWQ
ncbi:uncharacterized protein LOC125548158 [Triticum urartu]|uniref:uncharacterized protein LOC125526924 n=1 Tax=Triticum urartu TaxID=4572 RepID=UPI002043874E|nr:uncharacterized protein LOC125526924 [Triticum urartu]XP_048567787.1 uncharacterized protein LOC125548155 [Triticum urartu]XP_048567791.1 uncharacterized protein LOC125548158 [Triticum urartu]